MFGDPTSEFPSAPPVKVLLHERSPLVIEGSCVRTAKDLRVGCWRDAHWVPCCDAVGVLELELSRYGLSRHWTVEKC